MYASIFYFTGIILNKGNAVMSMYAVGLYALLLASVETCTDGR